MYQSNKISSSMFQSQLYSQSHIVIYVARNHKIGLTNNKNSTGFQLRYETIWSYSGKGGSPNNVVLHKSFKKII